MTPICLSAYRLIKVNWSGQDTNLDTVFAQRSNLFKPGFLLMLRDILRFNREAEANLARNPRNKISLANS